MLNKRELIKQILNPLMTWSRLDDPRPGFSILLGVPWALRHLLAVNLRFVSRQNLDDLVGVHLVFDRIKQPGGDAFVESIRQRFPELPLDFQFHPPIAGRITEKVNQSKFYAAMNWTRALAACQSRYAILHDFDLYPIDPRYFARMYETLKDNQWLFAGYETARFDGLTPEDLIFGSWNLALDAQWVRSRYRPIDGYHKVAMVNGRRVDLDPFSYLQTLSPKRGLVPSLGPDAFAHVKNLCSTFLRFNGGQKVDLAWRLHYLWYLESLSEHPERLEEATRAMQEARSSRLTVAGQTVDFQGTHVTCSNVLEKDLLMLEQNLYGGMRPEVSTYIDEFRVFLTRMDEAASQAAAS
ncbi:hypothetical protein [Tautonia marina]|uniref:hypothetical protein n=1 Tax=Tautonia marina TaxID=2653855 RepID=UPI001260B330|nr:hypothetical protein [Tautonia marina]